jgi:hypothetical protein
VSIIRVGLAETKKFAAGYEAIFSKNKKSQKSAKAPKLSKKAVVKRKGKKK